MLDASLAPGNFISRKHNNNIGEKRIMMQRYVQACCLATHFSNFSQLVSAFTSWKEGRSPPVAYVLLLEREKNNS